jgi:hypothetical protein
MISSENRCPLFGIMPNQRPPVPGGLGCELAEPSGTMMFGMPNELPEFGPPPKARVLLLVGAGPPN